MKSLSLIFLITLISCQSAITFSQTTIFGELNGNPVNTTGWNMTGSAVVNGDEIVLTPMDYNQSGTLYYNKSVDLGLCPQFTVEFEFRMFDEVGADGMAFCFLNQAPSGWVVGDALGVPPGAVGLKVAFDTWINGCIDRTPAIQILSGSNGYDECDPDVFRVNNTGSGAGVLGFMRRSAYNKARIIYDNGNVQVWLEKPAGFLTPAVFTLYANTTLATPIDYPGYFGFSASTGGVRDKHSIKNIKIFSNAVQSDAGVDLTTCADQANVIGTNPDAANTYSWSPATGLDQANIANPTATIPNSTNTAITNEYVVTTYVTASGPGCVTKDTIQLTVNPSFNTTESASFCIGDSYTIGGQTFTTAGTHLVTLQSQFNCDSIITLNLTANPAPTSILNQSICNGDSYSFNGQNYTTTGTYFATFPMPSGCDSVATLNLTVNGPFSPSTELMTICQGDSYSFGGATYTTTGDYTHTFTTLNGCDSLVTLELTVVDNFTSTINPVICQGDGYVLGGQTYTTAGMHVVTLQSVSGCDSIVTMNLTVNPSYDQVLNQSICQGSTYTFNGQTYANSGTYTANLQSVSGCDSIVTLNLTVSSSITNTLNESICQGGTYSFNNQTLNASGTYSGAFVSVGGCDSIVTLNLTVLPSFASTLNETICQGETYMFNGISETSAGTYTANLQSVVGCDSIVTLNLVVNPSPTLPEIISNSPLGCPGEEFIMQVVNPETTGTYAWTGPNNFASQGPNVSFVTTGSSAGPYSVVFQQNGCNSPAAVENLLIDGAELTDFDFPNVISPNDDMVNDFLDIDQFFNACTNYELIIWNRWGNLIYTQQYGDAPFNGHDQEGEKVTPGVYFYKIRYEGQERHGSITVMY